MKEQPHFVNTLQYNCVAKNDIRMNKTEYKTYCFLFTKKGRIMKLLV